MQSAVRDSVFQKVVSALQQTTYIEASRISEATRFKDDLAFGRFSRMKLSLYLEDIFDLELPDDVVERFITVADVVSYFSYRYFRGLEPPAKKVDA